jgi:hypothetical protein
MKAQILATGADQEELFEIRHDLEKAYGRAIELGYTPADDRVKQIVVWLAPYHKDHTFRYKETGYLLVPTAEDLVTIFRSMHLEIKATVRRHTSKRKRLSGQMPAERRPSRLVRDFGVNRSPPKASSG